MKKILHIAESFGGGVFSFLVDLANNTSDKYEITIAYGIRKETPENFKEYFSPNIKFIQIKNFSRNINPLYDFKALLEIKKILKKIKPDIIHLHSSKAGFIGRFAVDCKKNKVLYNPHGFSFLMKNHSKLNRRIFWWIEKIAALNKAIIIGCSNGEFEEAIKLSKRAICINNGIDTSKLDLITNGFKDKTIDFDNLKICTIGRIDASKNPRLFNNIAEKLKNIKFTWIGDGDLKNELVSSNIKVTGWKNKGEVIKLLNEHDVFLLTSLWEGLPLSLLEAMYMKKICIVSNCIGNKDVIIDGKNGIICENIDDFCNTLSNLKCLDADYLKEEAYKSVMEKYNITVMISNYLKLYEKDIVER